MDHDLNIGGFTPLTTIDYPDHLSCVIFCQGCAWRCRYCHNPELINSKQQGQYAWQTVYQFLQARQGLLDAVVFSGGEATLQAHLTPAMATVKTMGYLVGLHSAGIHYAHFCEALNYADWIGFDIKALPKDSQRITQTKHSAKVNWQSLAQLLKSQVAYECRTTIHWQLFDVEAVWQLAKQVHAEGVQHYCIQLAQSNNLLDPSLSHHPEPTEAQALWQELDQLFIDFKLRR